MTSSIQVLYKFYSSSIQVAMNLQQVLSSPVRMVGYSEQVLNRRDSVILNAKVTDAYAGLRRKAMQIDNNPSCVSMG